MPAFMRFCAVFMIMSHMAAAAETADEAQRVYESKGAAVYQVQVIDKVSGRKSGIGSGFQFTAGGLMATNYHVVAAALNDPQDNRLEYLHDGGGRGALRILAADVVHDLAVLEMDSPGPVFVALGDAELSKGARLFALGNPHDIGFTIVEGTYNGFARDSLIDKIHFSGALNPGMSGGPALGHDGRVVGVNVSTAGNQISFLVPVGQLQALVAGMDGAGEDFSVSAAARLRAQLLAAQDANMKTLLEGKWESMAFGPLLVPGRIHPALKCWGGPVHEEKDPYRYHRSVCGTQDQLYLEDEFNTGVYSYRYDYITAKEGMDPFRFARFYARQYEQPAGEGDGTEDAVSGFSCNTRFVDLAERRWKASFCVREYKRYPGVYDLEMYMAMLGDSRAGMIVSLEAEGVSRENALAFAARFMSEIRTAPPEAAGEARP